MRVQLAGQNDIEPWMKLAQQVIPLFGPMPDFEAVVQRKMVQRQAYCVRSSSHALFGAMLVGGTDTAFWIRWLAASRESRRRGIGRMLVETAILKAPPNAILIVDTFAEGSPGANAAGGLYRACGFEPTETWKSDRIVRQRYMRKSASSI